MLEKKARGGLLRLRRLPRFEFSKDIFLDQVNVGVTQEGEVIFTVAPDASNFVLQAGDTAFLENESAYMELGF